MIEDEELGRRLAAWLTDHDLTGPGARVRSVERPPGGRSNDTFLVDVEEDRAPGAIDHLVVRVEPTTTPIFRAPDVVREAAVLRGLAGTAVPVPRVRGCEPDPGVLGAPFFVMDAVAGQVPLARPSIHAAGWLPSLSRAELDTLWRSALHTVAAVHAVDWHAHHEFLLGAGESPSPASHVDRIAEWYRWSTAGRDYPITDAALEFVVTRSRDLPIGAPVLVWGDARVGNMIFGTDHRVAAAIDWETATIGAAEIDVAHWLFFDEFATTACDVEPLPGWPDAETVVATYEEVSGRRLCDLDLFQCLEELFIATTLIRQADARVERGLAPPDTRMGHDNAVTQILARRLGMPVPGLSPDYLAHRGGTT